ncbi:leucine-rich repeat-containing protein 61 [Protopterus annectens]|uniref:leucine-rich repeat-containing protein 61 n=1 Tax=Protopterus annectens TaxID=7888 RepID=UPI001CFC0137|nr:leucine-rich repeat-containing protein 61 [Protopterus annectens]
METSADREDGKETVKITVELLKSKSGEFDLESVLFLKLKGLGISDIGCIEKCVNLERVDLSDNSIKSLVALGSLKVLMVLNVSVNRIGNLEPLSACGNLQSLNAAGNLINSFDSLRCLTNLKKLETIRLHDSLHNHSNPICTNAAYRTIVLDMLPNIKVLDGERISGRGSDLYQLCKDIDNSLKGFYVSSLVGAIPSAKPWTDEGYWDLKTSQNDIVDKAYRQFNDILQECKQLSRKADDAIEQTERALEIKNNSPHYML